MSVKAWVKATISRRTTRGSSFRISNTSGRMEMVIKIPGFTGELRRYMTEEEIEEWVKKSNKDAFLSAAKASKKGMFGVDEFTATGSSSSGFASVMMKTAARGFGKKKDKDD